MERVKYILVSPKCWVKHYKRKPSYYPAGSILVEVATKRIIDRAVIVALTLADGTKVVDEETPKLLKKSVAYARDCGLIE